MSLRVGMSILSSPSNRPWKPRGTGVHFSLVQSRLCTLTGPFSIKAAGLVSSGYCNKAPQTGGLQTTEMRSLKDLEARSSKPRCPQGCAPPRGSRGGSCLASSSCWGSQGSSAYGCLPPASPLSRSRTITWPLSVLKPPLSLTRTPM